MRKRPRILTSKQTENIKIKMIRKQMRLNDLCTQLPSKPKQSNLSNVLNGKVINQTLEQELIDWLKNSDLSVFNKE